MFANKLKYLQGYVRVRLTGYAPERFLNLCSNRNILIWNLEFKNGNYEFFISLSGFRQLKPILRKTKTRLLILDRVGLPFFMHRYRKRKIFFGGIALCGGALYIMSLFIWNIEVQGNLHRTDTAIIQVLEENEIYHGIRKSEIDCQELEELLRSKFDDIIWASVKIQGTQLIIDVQENLATNYIEETTDKNTPTDLIADKEGEIYSILTRKGTPFVEKGNIVKKGDMLVEGKIPVYNDSGEIINYQYCYSDADILGITYYEYNENFSLNYEDKVFTGQEDTSYHLILFGKQIQLPFEKGNYRYSNKITTELPLKLGENFYFPIRLYKEVEKEYKIVKKTYTKEEAMAMAENKLQEFCEKLKQKGVQIIENNVIIVTEGNQCISKGDLKIIEPFGQRQKTTITEIQQEGQIENESDGNSN